MPFPKTIKVRVTRKDLRHKYVDPKSCPIAQAVKRAFPNADLFVGADQLHIWERGEGTRPTYLYRLRRKDNKKALNRAETTWGQIIGGFNVVLTEYKPF